MWFNNIIFSATLYISLFLSVYKNTTRLQRRLDIIDVTFQSSCKVLWKNIEIHWCMVLLFFLVVLSCYLSAREFHHLFSSIFYLTEWGNLPKISKQQKTLFKFYEYFSIIFELFLLSVAVICYLYYIYIFSKYFDQTNCWKRTRLIGNLNCNVSRPLIRSLKHKEN